MIDFILGEDGSTPLRGKDACNRINSYFCNISRDLASQITHVVPKLSPGYNTDLSEIWSFEIGKNEVIEHIENLNASKASGFTNICTALLKMVLKIIVDHFTVLLNLVLKKSVFPTAWKTAIVSIIPKSGSTSHVGNLRPISLLPVTGKIMEKIINFILMDYLESHNKLFDRQGGFRKGKSTVKTGHDLVNNILTNRNNGMASITAFIDIAKAFNCINHILLLNKVKILGFPPSLCKLIDQGE